MKTKLCPNCKTLYVFRKNGSCRNCGCRIVQCGEIWFPEDEGYFYDENNDKFIPLNKLEFKRKY